MSRNKTTFSEIKVGLLVLASVGIMIIFILSVSGEISIFKKRVTLYTRLVAADGLKAGDEVRLAGKRVGKVDDVSFSTAIPTTADQKSVVVRMELDESEVRDRIRTDSFA
ncbi:MAG: MlaD family protein, partial [Blastocatellia bacterium]